MAALGRDSGLPTQASVLAVLEHSFSGPTQSPQPRPSSCEATLVDFPSVHRRGNLVVKFKRKHKMLLVGGLCLPPPPPASLPAFSGLKPTVFY